jgi:predicted dehydrogenase
MDGGKTIKVGVYGAGGHSRGKHLPDLKQLDGVDVVAVCDINEESARRAAAKFDIPGVYTDGHRMLENEEFDALWSIVPAVARNDNVEVAAAERGIHLFVEKPQALDMATAWRIDAALQGSGALGTVCFRERYRPIFRQVKHLLEDKEIVHIRYQQAGARPGKELDRGIELGSTFMGWGPHAVDYARYMSGLDMVRVQAFGCYEDQYDLPLSTSCNFLMSNGATMNMTFVAAGAESPPGEPYFLFYYEGGYVGLHNYTYIDMNGKNVYQGEKYDPWYELDRVFVESIRSGDAGQLLNDYRDGLYSLAPVLAGWESARQQGRPIDIASFMSA